MSPKVSVFLPSYNKGAYVLDALNSVFSQTMDDWELWLLENSNDDDRTRSLVNDFLNGVQWHKRVHYIQLEGEDIERKRRETYMPAWLLNVYYPEAHGDYIFYLSDDDIIDKNCLEVMAGELDDHPEYQVVYAGLRTAGVNSPGHVGPFPDAGIPAQDIKGFPGSVDSRIDGGQVMHRKACLDHLVWPYFEELPDPDIARHADGIFLERLVGRFEFHPINRYLITHRWTAESLWSKIS